MIYYIENINSNYVTHVIASRTLLFDSPRLTLVCDLHTLILNDIEAYNHQIFYIDGTIEIFLLHAHISLNNDVIIIKAESSDKRHLIRFENYTKELCLAKITEVQNERRKRLFNK